MKKILTAILFILFSVFFFGLSDKDSENKIKTFNLFTNDSSKLDGNNISAWVVNYGSFDRNLITSGSGFEWPNGSGKQLTFASGLWLAAKVDSDTLVAVATYDYEYFPGYIDLSGNPQGKDDPYYKIYKIIKGDTTSPDYTNWPVSQGAYIDSTDKPFLPGTQTLFFSMTDG